MSRSPTARRDDERGSVVPLIVGLTAVLALLTAVVVDASAAFLRRQELGALADAAALAATDGVQGEAVYTSGLGTTVRIDPLAARRYAAAYLAAHDVRERFPRLAFTVHTSANTVVVRVSAPLRLPLHVGGVGDRPVVSATAASVVVIGR